MANVTEPYLKGASADALASAALAIVVEMLKQQPQRKAMCQRAMQALQFANTPASLSGAEVVQKIEAAV